MRAADRVEAAGLQQLDAALLDAINRCRAQRTVVVMEAATFELEVFVIEAKSVKGS